MSWIRFRKKLGRSIPYIVICTYGFIAIAPLIFMLLTSVKDRLETYELPIKYIDFTPDIQSYYHVFESRPFTEYIVNSIIVTISVTAVSVILGSLAAYGFARFRFKLNQPMFFTLLIFRLFPPVAMLVPFYILVGKWMGLMDNLMALIITYTYMFLPLAIWVMVGFFRSIPTELEDAAAIDGASRMQTFFRIMFPLAGPGIGAAGIMTFLFSWNEFLYAMSFTNTEKARTLSLGVLEFMGDFEVYWNQTTAAGVVACVPAIFFVLLFQKYIVRGLTSGAVKQ